jgi:hypothetical protein
MAGFLSWFIASVFFHNNASIAHCADPDNIFRRQLYGIIERAFRIPNILLGLESLVLDCRGLFGAHDYGRLAFGA